MAICVAATVIGLALLQISRWDGSVNADGVSYLDLASRFSHGDVGAVANGYWSPLYPVILAFAAGITHVVAGPNVTELKTVFATNAITIGLAALSLVRLFSILVRDRQPNGARAVLVLRALVAAALAIWCLIRMIGATTITPDALLAAITFLTSAEIAEAVEKAPANARQYAFGALLGIGYWTKAVFLPVALASIMGYTFVALERSRRGVLARCALGLVVVAAPLVTVQSVSQGHLSFGETGRLNYRWYVGRAPHAPPIHEAPAATRLRQSAAAVAIDAAPGSVLFTGDVGGSFPYWFDPSRFEQAGFGTLSLAAQWRALTISARWFRISAGLFVMLSGIALVAAIPRGQPRWRRWWVCAPAVATLALYTLSHPEGRMGAASIACILLVAITITSVGPDRRRPALLVAECAALGSLAMMVIDRSIQRLPDRATSLPSAMVLARAFRENGMRPGSEVGVVGTPYGHYWAHLNGARIVATIAPQDGEQRVLDDATLASVARELVTRGHPLCAIVWKDPVQVSSSTAISISKAWHMWLPQQQPAR
jgi:4-amino-4-deoxy-L-arabinose transferase-like glycosyltransferase